MKNYLLFLLFFIFASCQESTLLVDDGSAIKGCTDSKSVNYNPDAVINNGSCVYIDSLQNSIFGKFTATWCGPCGGWGVTRFEELYANHKGRALAISLQISDALTTPDNGPLVDEFAAKWQYTGTPNFFVNDNFVGTGASGIPGEISNKNNQTPKLSIGSHITQGAGKNAGKLNVNVYIKSFENLSGVYTMSALFLHKEIIASQNGSSQNPHIHHHVLSKSATTSGAFGEEIFTNLSNGEVYRWSRVINYDSNWDMSKMELVFIVWRKTSNGYEFVNCTTN
jgi:thioredoxin-related protein